LKRLVLFSLVAAVAAFSFPLSNLMAPERTTLILSDAASSDKYYRRTAKIFQNKCMDCHSAQTRYPFYTNFPIAKGIIEQDIAQARAHLELTDKISVGSAAFSNGDLAKLEAVVKTGSMPPLRYLIMHWNGSLSSRERDDILAWISEVRKSRDEGTQAFEEPVQPIPEAENLDPQLVALGNKLFHDKRLSADNTLSCASCHALNKGGTDQMKFSIGIRGQVGPINAPTVYNSAFNIKQFWDGRAATLEAQAGGPINNPIEMGSNWEQVLGKLQKDPAYVKAFEELFPGQGMTEDTVSKAIATFERSLVTPNSRFDQYLRGDRKILSDREVKGYTLFKESGCTACHYGPALGGESFERMGVRYDYFADRGHLTEADNGLFNVTQEEGDRHRFKVPTLRNIVHTYPYFHDGSTDDLGEAVQTMATYQLGKTLSDEDTQLIVEFLHTLTGEYEGKPVQ
jgi:cytochrome c peroxidase